MHQWCKWLSDLRTCKVVHFKPSVGWCLPPKGERCWAFSFPLRAFRIALPRVGHCSPSLWAVCAIPNGWKPVMRPSPKPFWTNSKRCWDCPAIYCPTWCASSVIHVPFLNMKPHRHSDLQPLLPFNRNIQRSPSQVICATASV